MKSNNIDVEIDSLNAFKKNLQDYGNSIAKHLATEFRDRLTIAAMEGVQGFYDDYTPEKYRRKWQLKKSFHPYYTKQNTGWRYHGGVEFNTNSMKENAHHDSNEYILNISLEGIHGTSQIYMNSEYILQYVLKERQILFDSISETGNDSISNKAISKARMENNF